MALYARRLGVFALFVIAETAMASHLDWIAPPTVFAIMALCFTLAILALLMALYAFWDIWRTGIDGVPAALKGALCGGAILILPAVSLYHLTVYPRLIDVSTNPADPPRFEKALFGRSAISNVVGDPAADAITRQQIGFPDIVPRTYDDDVQVVFKNIQQLVRERGWIVRDAIAPVDEQGTGRLEATAKTRLFAIPDDVVIQVRPDGEATRVDMRSASRYGRHDLGANGRRVTTFLRSLDEKMNDATPGKPTTGGQ